ncbi:MAG: hypothetical protein Q8N28_00515 [bacterium]|nr:hypothetical protein [bacterium]
MRNLSEKTLVQKLDKILKKEFGTNLAFHEFSAGYGIADLVFAPDFSFRKNDIKRTPLTDFNCLNLLISLEKGEIYSLDQIRDFSPSLDIQNLKKNLNLLVNNQYMKKISANSYVKIGEKDELNQIKKIIAIEVKLSDHKGGLVQARRYQYFADESYLAILKEAKKNIDFREFNKYNIGLILFDTATNTIEIKSPKRRNQNNEDNVSIFAKQMMLSRFLSFSS